MWVRRVQGRPAAAFRPRKNNNNRSVLFVQVSRMKYQYFSQSEYRRRTIYNTYILYYFDSVPKLSFKSLRLFIVFIISASIHSNNSSVH